MSKAKPGSPIKCFLLTETNRAWRWLRRFNASDDDDRCPSQFRYHNAQFSLGVAQGFTRDQDGNWRELEGFVTPPSDDPRWPTKCEHCAYVFKDTDHFQVFDEHIHVTEDGREFSIRNAPPGAMWYADWMGENYFGPDGHCLVVRCPDGRDWMIDGPASNCTDKQDVGPFGKAHRCWVRHGTPPLIVVDKKGKTCKAGAGSIDTKHKYHGFLGSHGAQPGEFT